ncbi:MAG TPA: 50S ribosomal protein L29 [Gemmatimonadota bacterium]|nr:50S ribosomal protein L29 [Gemmatimonadota bacterium]
MKTEEIRGLSAEELDDRIAELEDELFRLRIQNQSGQLENPLRIRGARKDLARCKTIRNEAARQGA